LLASVPSRCDCAAMAWHPANAVWQSRLSSCRVSISRNSEILGFFGLSVPGAIRREFLLHTAQSPVRHASPEYQDGGVTMTVPSGGRKRNWGVALVHVSRKNGGNLPALGLGVDALVRTAHRLSEKCASRRDCAALVWHPANAVWQSRLSSSRASISRNSEMLGFFGLSLPGAIR